MHQPQGFEKPGKGNKPLVCLLMKSLYGLKQSGRNWFQTLSSYLSTLGFVASISDPCLFLRKNGSVYYYVCVWVDDIIYFSTDDKFKHEFEV